MMLLLALAIIGVAHGQTPSAPITSISSCDNSTFDVVFVLDSSGSVGDKNFTVMKEFVKEVIRNLQIGPAGTSVGLITFSRYPILRIHLGDYSDANTLLAAVDTVPYVAGITETDSALQLLRNEGFLGSRPNTPNIAIVITDGKSFHSNRTSASATQVKQDGTTVFSIGIGTEINQPELKAIASDPDSNYVFTVKNFNSLRTIVDTITSRTCKVKPSNNTVIYRPTNEPLSSINNTAVQPSECNKTLADLVFVLDSSGSLGPDNFNLVKQFVINVVNYLDVGQNFTRVGVITYSNYPNRRIFLNRFTDKLQLMNAINQIPYYPGNTETDKALDLLRLEGFEGDRVGVPNIAIVVTDGLSTNPDLTKIASTNIKNSGVTVFAIGIGNEIDTKELDYISSDPNKDFVFFVANFTDLSSIERQVAKTTCAVPRLTTTTEKIPTTAKPTTPTTTTTTTTTTPKPTTTTTTPVPTTTTTTLPPTTTPSCFAKVADVMFVVDSSGSVGEQNFVQIKAFMTQLISVFDIGSLFTRVGAITFSTDATLEFALDKYNTSTALVDAVDKIPYTQGGTNTAAALEMLRLNGFSNERSNDPNIAIVITDGFSRDKDATRLQARLVKADTNVTIIAIGIGNGTDFGELTDIATTDQGGKSLVYQVGDFAALQTLQQVVATVACGFNVLHPETTKPPTEATTTSSDCIDTEDNCADYGFDICHDYRPWSMAHCARHCGFCVAPPTDPPACVDTLDHCEQYGTYICTTSSLSRWTQQHCRKYCGYCDGGSLPTNPPSTPRPTDSGVCHNTITNCDEYGGKEMCKDPAYEQWARGHCAEYCNFCTVYVLVKGSVNPSTNSTCPDWLLPRECKLMSNSPSCCPTPLCPPGYTLSVQQPPL